MNFPTSFPKQKQNTQPGLEYEMNPIPIFDNQKYDSYSELLKDKVAISVLSVHMYL